MTDARHVLRSGHLWHTFCDALSAAGAHLDATDVPGDDMTRAEGLRYLARLLRLGLEKNIEFANPDYPRFYALSHETAKIGNDNPDNIYLNCAVDGRRDYRVYGNCGSVAYLSIETKAGSFVDGGDMAPTGHVELADLELDEQGNFELIVSAREHHGNWLAMRPDSDNILVRQTFRHRRQEQAAQMDIECLNPAGDSKLQPERFGRQLLAAAAFVDGTAGLFSGWMRSFATHINQLPPNDQQMCLRAGGDPAIHYHNSRWQLAPDEALEILFMPPRRYRAWNFQLSNYWMESLDYRYHRICINNDAASVQADGSIRLLVAHHDPGPGCPNWLSTAGHAHGAMLLRYVEASDFPPVQTRVLPFAELTATTAGAPR